MANSAEEQRIAGADTVVLQTRSETRRLRLHFLVPLLLAILVAVTVLIADIYLRKQHDIQLGVVRLRTSATRLYDEGLRQNVQALRTVMDVLSRDEELRTALARKDRLALLAHSAPLFEDMKRNYGITHLYFTGPDRVNLLRAHKPERYGDVIDRVTTRLAERSGAPAHGVEIGPLGTFTLRLVAPWHDEYTHRLLGYVELGMEIDKVLENMRHLFDVEVFVLVRKEFLERKAWEDGMRTLGRTPDWDRFPGVVLSLQALRTLPPALAERFTQGRFENVPSTMEVTRDNRPHQAVFLPLQDAAGRTVAGMVLLVDVSQEVEAARHTVILGSLLSVATGGVLFTLFYWLVGRIGRRIEHDEQLLRQLATHDGLTGLYNHRTFHSILEDEIDRVQRYGGAVSLLMLDIDHFKRVNDTYGHVAGDRILEGLARILKQSLRQVDSVCRYGGEEVGIILPETDTQVAVQSAERLRAEVEKARFKDDSGREIRITVSIGVAALPEQATNLQELVSAADTALYAAKEGGRNRVCRYEKPAAERS